MQNMLDEVLGESKKFREETLEKFQGFMRQGLENIAAKVDEHTGAFVELHKDLHTLKRQVGELEAGQETATKEHEATTTQLSAVVAELAVGASAELPPPLPRARGFNVGHGRNTHQTKLDIFGKKLLGIINEGDPGRTHRAIKFEGVIAVGMRRIVRLVVSPGLANHIEHNSPGVRRLDFERQETAEESQPMGVASAGHEMDILELPKGGISRQDPAGEEAGPPEAAAPHQYAGEHAGDQVPSGDPRSRAPGQVCCGQLVWLRGRRRQRWRRHLQLAQLTTGGNVEAHRGVQRMLPRSRSNEARPHDRCAEHP